MRGARSRDGYVIFRTGVGGEEIEERAVDVGCWGPFWVGCDRGALGLRLRRGGASASGAGVPAVGCFLEGELSVTVSSS